MFRVKRNQVVILTLVVMIGVAGYLNYIDNSNGNGTPIALNDNGDVVALVPDGTSASDIATVDDPSIAVNSVTATKTANSTSDAKTANSTADAKTANASTDTSVTTTNSANSNTTTSPNVNISATDVTPGEAVFVNSSTDTSYFVQAKLSREQSRSKETDMLMGMVNSASITPEKKSAAADEILQLQQRVEKETAAEAMIESKGFSEAYVRIDDSTVDVVVNKTSLTDAEIAQIQDIVSRKTGLSADKIRINTMKNSNQK